MTVEFALDVSQIEKFEKQTLDKIKKFAFPLAIQNTLNTAAFTTMRQSRKTIREDFEDRNKFTERSILVNKAKTLKISEMVATAGSKAEYMLDQEEGRKVSSKGKQGLRIPTGAAAGQRQQFPRKKVIKKQFRRGQFKLANTSGVIKAKSRAQFILMSIRVAALRGRSPFVFLSFGGGKAGIYKVIPRGAAPSPRYKRGKSKITRKNKWGRPKGTPGREKLVLIHSFAHKSITIPESKWLSKNANQVGKSLPKIFEKEADRVFDRFVK